MYIDTYNLLVDIARTFQIKEKWFFFQREMLQQGEVE
jgi:hypothetical protein